MTLANASVFAHIDLALLRTIMRSVESRTGRPQECVWLEPELVTDSDDGSGTLFHYPPVTYLLSYAAAPHGTFAIEVRGGTGIVYSQRGEVVFTKRLDMQSLGEALGDALAEARRRGPSGQPELN